jgi:hypothetical protein
MPSEQTWAFHDQDHGPLYNLQLSCWYNSKSHLQSSPQRGTLGTPISSHNSTHLIIEFSISTARPLGSSLSAIHRRNLVTSSDLALLVRHSESQYLGINRADSLPQCSVLGTRPDDLTLQFRPLVFTMRYITEEPHLTVSAQKAHTCDTQSSSHLKYSAFRSSLSPYDAQRILSPPFRITSSAPDSERDSQGDASYRASQPTRTSQLVTSLFAGYEST